jgi:trans-2,3-dihydro-3-hydroxyanthranilate isomerase
MVARACGIEQSELDVTRHSLCFISCGVPFLVAEVRNRAALKAASPRTDVFTEHLPPDRATGILLYVRDTADGFDLQTRMFAPLMGIAEDPATGSANAALAGLLTFLEPGPEGSHKLRIGQGFELGRPSILEAIAVKRAGRVSEMRIGGECVSMMDGFVDL